jgi:hypothetical protein
MISVVICSVSQALAAQVKRNIDTSIGVPWELILLDNSVLKKGITEVYNIGAARARFDILCFVHEDVLFTTQDWGKKILGYFSTDPALGAVGVAGAKYKSKTLSGWSTGITEFDCCNILHVDRAGNKHRIYSNPSSVDALDYSVTLDGVFICVKKDVWEKNRFDDEYLKGFHLYDIDFSFRVSLNHKVAVTFEIDITHLTEGGDFGNAWLNYTIGWHEIYGKSLPRYITNIRSDRISKIEKEIKRNWLERLKVEKISVKNRMRWIVVGSSYKNILLVPTIAKFLIFRLFKKLKAR